MSYALITGSAKGIGRGLAHEMAHRSYNLLLIDRDSEGIQKTATEIEKQYQVSVKTLVQDLGDPMAVDRIKSWSEPFHKELQVVINNAGFGLNGAFADLPLDEQLSIIDVNVKAIVGISHTFIPILKKQPKAYLMNLGSNAAYQAVPYLCMYAASKAFVVSFTRGIRYELRNSNISVTCLTAGSTESSFMDRAGMGEAIRKTAVKYELPAAAVASIGIKAMFRGEAEVQPGFNTKLGIFLARHAPKFLSEKFGANIFQPRN